MHGPRRHPSRRCGRTSLRGRAPKPGSLIAKGATRRPTLRPKSCSSSPSRRAAVTPATPEQRDLVPGTARSAVRHGAVGEVVLADRRGRQLQVQFGHPPTDEGRERIAVRPQARSCTPWRRDSPGPPPPPGRSRRPRPRHRRSTRRSGGFENHIASGRPSACTRAEPLASELPSDDLVTGVRLRVQSLGRDPGVHGYGSAEPPKCVPHTPESPLPAPPPGREPGRWPRGSTHSSGAGRRRGARRSRPLRGARKARESARASCANVACGMPTSHVSGNARKARSLRATWRSRGKFR